MIQHEIRKPWGDGTLSVAFDAAERAIVAAYSFGDKLYGPVKVMDLPSQYDSPEKLKWAVKQTFSSFDADLGGDEYFTSMFGPEAGVAAYGGYRKKAEEARRHLSRSDAVKIAEDLLEAFYMEARPGQTPFDNWALVNRLNAKTFGTLNGVDQILRVMEEADANIRRKHGDRLTG